MASWLVVQDDSFERVLLDNAMVGVERVVVGAPFVEPLCCTQEVAGAVLRRALESWEHISSALPGSKKNLHLCLRHLQGFQRANFGGDPPCYFVICVWSKVFVFLPWWKPPR